MEEIKIMEAIDEKKGGLESRLMILGCIIIAALAFLAARLM